MKRRLLTCIAVILCLAALTLATACQPPVQDLPYAKQAAWVPKKIAVLPYQVVNSTPNAGPCCPLTGATTTGGEIIPGAAQSLDNDLDRMLPRITEVPLVPFAQSGLVFTKISGRSLEDSLRDEIRETGMQLGADAVAIGFVYRFQQRVGSNISVETPAAVSFDLSVVRVRDGRIIWQNNFDAKQQSLSQDILNLEQYMKHGLKWYTAQEMGKIGMQKLLQRWPWKKPGEPKE